jgi:hypothetical protein
MDKFIIYIEYKVYYLFPFNRVLLKKVRYTADPALVPAMSNSIHAIPRDIPVRSVLKIPSYLRLVGRVA